ncbi:MAG: AtpZ/AtpI family protein [Planctomycetes bacterium]|nr:AtpZ/AtpI family protein [Planctomycetota bacterium]
MALQDQYSVLKYGHLGLTFVIVLGGSFFLGVEADKRFGTGSILTLLGGAIGMATGFYYLLSSVSRLTQEGSPPGELSDTDDEGKSETDS